MRNFKTIFSVALVGLFMLISFNSFSQGKQGDLIIKAAMAEIVNQGKEYYKPGMSLDAFVQETGQNVKQLNSVELALTTDVYNYIKNGNSSNSIIEQYNGVSLKNAAKAKAFNWAPVERGKPCRFWCWIGRVVELLSLILLWT